MAWTPEKAEIDGDLVKRLAELLEETGLSEIEYGRDGWHVKVAKGGTVMAAASAAGPAPQTDAPTAGGDADLAAHPGAVTSPMVGIVYTAPEPDSAPFVKVGDQVAKGQTLLLIEAMKVFNAIEAPHAGKVSRILVSGGTPVEFGEPLLIIE
jgi:acetyl-CoA carboxylase biotin carboxyl carrier protein